MPSCAGAKQIQAVVAQDAVRKRAAPVAPRHSRRPRTVLIRATTASSARCGGRRRTASSGTPSWPPSGTLFAANSLGSVSMACVAATGSITGPRPTPSTLSSGRPIWRRWLSRKAYRLRLDPTRRRAGQCESPSGQPPTDLGMPIRGWRSAGPAQVSETPGCGTATPSPGGLQASSACSRRPLMSANRWRAVMSVTRSSPSRGTFTSAPSNSAKESS